MNKFQAAETKPGADGEASPPARHGDGQSPAPGFDCFDYLAEKMRRNFCWRYYEETIGGKS